MDGGNPVKRREKAYQNKETERTRTRTNGAELGRPAKVPSSAWNVERARPAPASDPEVRSPLPSPPLRGVLQASVAPPIYQTLFHK